MIKILFYKQYQIDFVVHGDDPCIVDGKDVYETAKVRIHRHPISVSPALLNCCVAENRKIQEYSKN